MTGTPNLDLAPGCYGSALAFNDEAPECKGCPFRGACAPVSADRLAKLREELNLTEIAATSSTRRIKKAEKVEDGGSMMTTLPKKVQALVDQIDKKGIKVSESLRTGKNPFDKPAFLKVAAHLLLRMPGGFDRHLLRAALQHKFGWSEGTATAHVGQIFALMPALGAAIERNGKLILKKD